MEVLPSAEDIRSLRILSQGNWEEFWLQGGEFSHGPPRQASVYLIPAIAIKCSSTIVEIGATAVNLPNRTELFPMALQILPEIGTPESERMTRPPRKPVATFPSDLDLIPFIHSQVEIDILFDNNDPNHLLFDAIIIEQGENRLLITSTVFQPESIEITRREDYIATFLDRRIRRPVPAT